MHRCEQVGGVGGVGQEAPEQAASIHGVALPHSERLAGVDEIQLGVALGHVAHFVHILSILLQVRNINFEITDRNFMFIFFLQVRRSCTVCWFALLKLLNSASYLITFDWVLLCFPSIFNQFDQFCGNCLLQVFVGRVTGLTEFHWVRMCFT